MKKILLPISVTAMLLLVSCEAPSPKSVYEKFEKKEKIEIADFKVMTDFLIQMNSKDASEFSEEEVDMCGTFLFAVGFAPEGIIDSETMKKLESLENVNAAIGTIFLKNNADEIIDDEVADYEVVDEGEAVAVELADDYDFNDSTAIVIAE